MATTTTVQLGTYSALTDSFTLGLDINDRATYYADKPEFPQAPKEIVSSWNIRTVGERVVTQQHKNRVITVTLAIVKTGGTVDQLLAAATTLQQQLEKASTLPQSGTLNVLKLQAPNATRVRYSVIQHVTHDIDYFVKDVMAQGIGGKKRIHIAFTCSPFSFSIPRQWLSNLVTNPGFEAPSGPGVVVFNDTFLNFNAYAVQAGGALAQDTLRYPDVVTADAPNIYYRCDEASGTTIDAEANHNSLAQGAGITFGATGGLTGDTDTAYTLNGTTGWFQAGGSAGFAGGNNAVSVECLFKFAANPGANLFLCDIGTTATPTAHNAFRLYVNTSGKVVLDNGGGAVCTAAAASTTGAYHYVLATWDGTTMSLYVDNATVVTATPGNQTVPASPNVVWGANNQATAGFWNGQIDECALYGAALSGTRQSAHYTAFSTTPAVTANTMLIPVGGREAFGSPAWGAIQTWQVRFRYVSSLVATFYLHYTDANNNLSAVVSGTSLTLFHTVGGTAHSLGGQTITLVNGVQYWLQMTQFVNQPLSFQPFVQAQVFADHGGAVGTAVAVLLGPFATFDAVTALVGRPQIAASGAALGLGGNFANVHTASLFGPGGWLFQGLAAAATGTSSGAWEGDVNRGASGLSANTYPNGPVTSFGAGRIDLAPAGQVDAYFNLYNGGAATGTPAMPVQTPGNTIGVSAWCKSSGLGANAVIRLDLREYNSSGVLVLSSTIQTLTGNQASWTQLSGSLVTQNTTAFLDVRVHVVDTNVGASANGTVWFDNVLCWDQTRTGMMSMPYCELRFAQSLAQLLVSGILGDVPAPTLAAVGLFYSSIVQNQTVAVYLGRRAVTTPSLVLLPPAGNAAFGPSGYVLDSTSYSGFYQTFTTAGAGLINLDSYSALLRDCAGAYALLLRSYTTDSVPTAALVSVQIVAFLIGSHTYGDIQTLNISPYANAGVWTLVDCGRVFLPPNPAISLVDPTKIALQWTVLYNPGNGNANTYRLNQAVMVPVDGETVIGKYTWGFPNTVTATWHFFYFDLIGRAISVSRQGVTDGVAPIPTPAASGGGSGITTNVFAPAAPFNSTGDVGLQFDPTQLTPNGGTTGVNQFALATVDSTGVLVPALVEFTYSPQYLYPL